jgi:hypothetical protein
MISYASRTGTIRNLDALRSSGWRLLVSATGCLRSEGFPYALDNGAWTAFQQGHPFDESAFTRALRMMGRDADWTVIPDIVAGGLASLEMSFKWMRRVLDESPRALIAVQDGMTTADLADLIGPRVGIFVGGSTDWKLATLPMWAALASQKGAWCHVGRVNTARRIRACSAAGATSFDGTSATKFSVTIPKLTHARDQLALRFQ